jgi:hypothetical protein
VSGVFFVFVWQQGFLKLEHVLGAIALKASKPAGHNNLGLAKKWKRGQKIKPTTAGVGNRSESGTLVYVYESIMTKKDHGHMQIRSSAFSPFTFTFT